MVIDFDQARDIVMRYLHKVSPSESGAIVTDDALTIEAEDGWCFFYNSREFLELGDMSSMLLGNNPLFVRCNGELWELLPHIPVDDFLRKYYSGTALDELAIRHLLP